MATYIVFPQAVVPKDVDMTMIEVFGFSDRGYPGSASCAYICTPWRVPGLNGEMHIVCLLTTKQAKNLY